MQLWLIKHSVPHRKIAPFYIAKYMLLTCCLVNMGKSTSIGIGCKGRISAHTMLGDEPAGKMP